MGQWVSLLDDCCLNNLWESGGGWEMMLLSSEGVRTGMKETDQVVGLPRSVRVLQSSDDVT
jgi:hypothetical protein